MSLSAERLREVLDYDRENGVFRWAAKTNRKTVLGGIAGCRTGPNGYTTLQVDGRRHYAHRLAWLHAYGFFPNGQIDHINGIRGDNRLNNLRDVTASVNQQNQRTHHRNNKAGFLGVFQASKGAFAAHITVGGERRYLGCFKTPEEAHQKYIESKRIHHEGSTI